MLCCGWEVESVPPASVAIAQDAFLRSSDWELFREETEAAFSLTGEEQFPDVGWTEGVEAHLESFAEDKDTVEFLLKDLSTAESKEDVEEDTEEVCSAEDSGAEIQEEEGVRGGEGASSGDAFWSFPLRGDEPEEVEGGENCAAGGEPGSAAGEDGGEVWDNLFFSEECDDNDSWLPIGVVSGLLLNVSPEKQEETPHQRLRSQTVDLLSGGPGDIWYNSKQCPHVNTVTMKTLREKKKNSNRKIWLSTNGYKKSSVRER